MWTSSKHILSEIDKLHGREWLDVSRRLYGISRRVLRMGGITRQKSLGVDGERQWEDLDVFQWSTVFDLSPSSDS